MWHASNIRRVPISQMSLSSPVSNRMSDVGGALVVPFKQPWQPARQWSSGESDPLYFYVGTGSGEDSSHWALDFDSDSEPYLMEPLSQEACC